MANKTLPYDVSPSDLRLRIESEVKNPNVGRVITAPLKSGPKSFRYATIFEIIDPVTHAHHHWCLRIDSITRSKRAGWVFKPDRSVSLDDKDSTELADLAHLIEAALSGGLSEERGSYHLVPAAHLQTIRSLVRFARQADATQRLQVVRALMDSLDVGSIDASEWLTVFESGAENVRRTVALASRLAEYTGVRDQLAQLIADTEVKEQVLQSFLSRNPWVFGSEYSQLEPRRNWTRDDRLDFMLRRTADDYLEIIEIKTPFREPLLRYDSSHDSYFPSAQLSMALGQVFRYIEEIERSRDQIRAADGCDPLKIRSRIIIGRDGDTRHQAALRTLNGHLHRIEVLTFDQLLRIAERTLSVFSQNLATEGES